MQPQASLGTKFNNVKEKLVNDSIRLLCKLEQ